MLTKILPLLLLLSPLSGAVQVGADRLHEPRVLALLEGKRVALVTNQTGVDRHLRSTVDLIQEHAGPYRLIAFFSPEHGFLGSQAASESVDHAIGPGGLPIYSLHGETRRPTEKMLEEIDVIVYDIQDVGVRCYTYPSTLFYMMEEAAKRGIDVIVLDRPNPINGVTVDGPHLDPKWRSFIGYIDVPFVHGMTVGELARFFNGEYKIGCRLHVVAMRGWHRTMTFRDTGLPWVPTSPQIPEPDTPLYYASTVLFGESFATASIGVGTTLPFKVVGAPWIDGERLADALARQNLSGVRFQPYAFTPFFGRFKGECCRGVRIVVTDPKSYRPVVTQFMIMGMIKNLYPKEFDAGLHLSDDRRAFLAKAAGSEEVLSIIQREQYIAWPLAQLDEKRRERYLQVRAKYLLYQ